MRNRKNRRLWPITFAILFAGMAVTFSILLAFGVQSVRDINLHRIQHRNRTALALSAELIESRIDKIIGDLELLLVAVDNLDEAGSSAVIRDYLDRNPMWVTVHVVDDGGRIMYSVPEFPDIDGFDISGMGYYQEWKRAGRTTFYDLELTMKSDRPFPTVIGSSGKTTLAAHIDLDPLASSLLPLIEGDDVDLCLHDSRGNFLIHPDADLVRDRAANPFGDIISESYQGGILNLSLESGGDRIIVHAVEIADLGWYLGVYQNETAVDRESLGSLKSAIPALIVLILFLLAIALTVSKLVTRPFSRIADQIEKGVGTTGFRLRTMGFRETDEVTAAMNRLMSTLEKQAEDLKSTRDRAEEANRAKDLFLANMSHELLTPLNGIHGAAALLKDVDTDAEGTRLLALQESSIEQLRRLIMDLLDYSRVQEGDIKLEIVRFRPVPLIEETLTPFIAEAEQKELNFITKFKTDPALTLTTDPVRLKQIVKHLVENAVKFTETGGVAVELSVENPDEEDCRIVLKVKDTGRGMPREKIGTLIERFTQGEETYTKTIRGAGMGLALADSLTGLLGGELAIDSEPYAGTTATVRLPKVFKGAV